MEGHQQMLAAAGGSDIDGFWIGEGFGASMPAGLVIAGDRDHVRAGIEDCRRIGVTDLVARVIPGETPVTTAIDTISALADMARTYTQEPRRL